MSEPVGRADDECREGVAGIDVRRPTVTADARRLEADLWRRGRRVGAVRRGGLSGDHDELDLNAVADDPRQGLADQRAIAGFEPVLRKAVRDANPEALLIDIDELGFLEPRLVIGG